MRKSKNAVAENRDAIGCIKASSIEGTVKVAVNQAAAPGPAIRPGI